MIGKTGRLFEFGPFRLDAEERLLFRSGETVTLSPKSFDLLLVLVENPGHLLEKEQLMKRLWPDSFVEEANLSHHVFTLRKALNEGETGALYIETVRGRGYRFVAPARELKEAEKLSATSEATRTSAEPPPDRTSSPPTTGQLISAAEQGFHPGGKSVLQEVSRRKWNRLAVASVMLIAISVGLIWWLNRSASMPSRGIKLTQLTFDSGLTTDPALSADAKLLVYASDRSGEGNLDIWLKHLVGGEPSRLTQDPGDDHEPTFSLDGSQIVFRSERDGGGIYLIPTLGGEPRLIARAGQNPRFSPDGNWIAYWVGQKIHIPGSQPIAGKLYLISPQGGLPKQLQPEFVSAANPVWSPDGNYVVFYGNQKEVAAYAETSDWWVASVNGGAARKTGAFDVFRRQQLDLRPHISVMPAPADWVGSHIFFAAELGDSVNLWRVPISPKSWQVTGPAERLTSGPGLEIQPTLAPDGSLVFSSLVHRLNLWGLPLDTNLGRVSGPISQLTQNVAQDFHTSISADGRKVVFATTRSGNRDIWIKDLESGKETPLAVSPSSKIKPIISADGSRVVYWDSGVRDRLPRLVGRLYVIGTEEGPAEQVCDNCGWAWDWLPEKEGLIFSQIVEGRFTLDLLNLATKRITSFLQDPSYYLFNARFSQDGLWIVFKAGPPEADWSRVFIIPFRGEGAPKKSEWVAVTDDHGWNDNPHWSPDGELIYFTSNRDGFVCLWMQPVEPTNKQPLGSPRPVYHFHEARRSMTNVNIGGLTLSVARNKIVFPQGELNGNLWKAEPEGRP